MYRTVKYHASVKNGMIYKPGVKFMRKIPPFFSFVLYVILSVPFLRNAPLGGFKKIKRASLI